MFKYFTPEQLLALPGKKIMAMASSEAKFMLARVWVLKVWRSLLLNYIKPNNLPGVAALRRMSGLIP